ncbi:NADPH-dependent F420 reductase [Cyanobium sp. Lug-B]|nr:NADPH-dependent F420 reductase [Cyanobium sp. Lug-B]
MNIAIIGTGNVGKALAERWLAKGHHVMFGSRDPAAPKIAALLAALGPAASSASLEDAPTEADVVVLAVPWEAALTTVGAMGDLSNKVLIDATNPIAMTPEGLQEGLVVGHQSSAAEQIADVAMNARVVKAFNQAGAGIMANPAVKETDCTMFICGDDEEAKRLTTELAADLSLRVLDAGPLRQARLLEPLGMLWIHMCYLRGQGPNFCFSVTDIAGH